MTGTNGVGDTSSSKRLWQNTNTWQKWAKQKSGTTIGRIKMREIVNFKCTKVIVEEQSKTKKLVVQKSRTSLCSGKAFSHLHLGSTLIFVLYFHSANFWSANIFSAYFCSANFWFCVFVLPIFFLLFCSTHFCSATFCSTFLVCNNLYALILEYPPHFLFYRRLNVVAQISFLLQWFIWECYKSLNAVISRKFI